MNKINLLEIKNQLAERVIGYFAQNEASQIFHTLNVAYFTQHIVEQEAVEKHRAMLLIMAALLHDIGCPESRRKYGNTLPVHQEEEGLNIATFFLENVSGLTAEEKKWIANVVGNHHHYNKVQTLHFEAVYDADMIVNLLEGFYDKKYAEKYIKQISTESGKNLFCTLFIEHQ